MINNDTFKITNFDGFNLPILVKLRLSKRFSFYNLLIEGEDYI